MKANYTLIFTPIWVPFLALAHVIVMQDKAQQQQQQRQKAGGGPVSVVV